jgi:hypothetical protein
MIPGAPENKRLDTPYQNKAIQPTKLDGIHHYQLVQRLGFPQGAKCWCGESFLPTNHEKGVMQKRREWFNLHDSCEAKVSELA